MLLALGMMTAPGSPTLPFRHDPTAQVKIDKARKEVVVTLGPFLVPNMPPGMDHADMAMMNNHNTPVIRFAWPVAGWLRGFRIDVADAEGKPLPVALIHHLIGINFDRRQLVYPAAERIFGAGAETGTALVPKSIGVPMKVGANLGVYLAWQNTTGKDIDCVTITVRLPYSPENLSPRPVDALPFYADVNLTVGGEDAFDVVPGHSEKSFEFTVPAAGRLLAFGGHMHDYGTSVRLEEVASGKVIAKVIATRTADGKVTSVSRALPGVTGEGIKLKTGTRYRVTGVYDNPTGKLLRAGAMAHIVGLFAPDDLARWPALDLADKGMIADLADLDRMGKGMAMHAHDGMDMDH
ncbi:MAG: hypothetical protein ABIZ70_05040 [Gemmatimonadales bacterium]